MSYNNNHQRGIDYKHKNEIYENQGKQYYFKAENSFWSYKNSRYTLEEQAVLLWLYTWANEPAKAIDRGFIKDRNGKGYSLSYIAMTFAISEDLLTRTLLKAHEDLVVYIHAKTGVIEIPFITNHQRQFNGKSIPVNLKDIKNSRLAEKYAKIKPEVAIHTIKTNNPELLDKVLEDREKAKEDSKRFSEISELNEQNARKNGKGKREGKNKREKIKGE